VLTSKELMTFRRTVLPS